MSPQTICLVGPAAPYRGGIAHYNTRLARALAEQHDVRLFNFSRMYPALLFPGKTQLDESAEPISHPSTRMLDSLSPLSWRRTAREIVRSAPDRIVFQWWHPFFAPCFGAVSFFAKLRARHVRQVFVCHNVLPHERGLADGVLTRFAFSAADAFVVHSETERALLSEFVRERPVAAHPHPPYDLFRAPSLTREEARRRLGVSGRVILFFGYVREYKGLRYALEALPAILSELDVTLLVAGEFYEDRRAYEQLAERLGVSERVVLHDRYIANEDVASYFLAADLVLQPYVSATQSGISQIAFDFGRPVIATSVGGIPEAIRDRETGFIVPPRDARAIAAAALEFFRKGHAERMRKTIAEQAGEASWATLGEALLAV